MKLASDRAICASWMPRSLARENCSDTVRRGENAPRQDMPSTLSGDAHLPFNCHEFATTMAPDCSLEARYSVPLRVL